MRKHPTFKENEISNKNESNRIVESNNLSPIESNSKDKKNNETTESTQPQIIQPDHQNASEAQQRSDNENIAMEVGKMVDESRGGHIGGKKEKRNHKSQIC